MHRLLLVLVASLAFALVGSERDDVAARLAQVGVRLERWDVSRVPAEQRARNLDDTEKATILAAFQPEIDRLKADQGYQAADVITLQPETPKVDELIAMFARLHTHAGDEVRLILGGGGTFTVYPDGGEPIAVTVGAGDFIRLPNGLKHRFQIGDDKRVTALRVYTDKDGTKPVFTDEAK